MEFPVPRTCPHQPPPEYQRFRESDRLPRVRLPTGQPAWVVSRYADVRQVLNDDSSFASARTHPDFPRYVPGGRLSRPENSGDVTLTRIDGPEHRAARRAVAGEFTVRRVEALRPGVQRIVDGLIDAMRTGPDPADLVAALAEPTSALVIGELLGVPHTDHEIYLSSNATMMDHDAAPEDRRAAHLRMFDRIDRLVTEKESDPPDDLLGRQITRARAEGTYHHGNLVAFAYILFQAGYESTANMISLGTLALLRNPDQLAKLRDDPGRMPSAVEEMLRYFSILDQATARLCTVDTRIGGVTIRAGEGVLALNYAANWDPTAFPRPDAFDVDRDARHQLAFGFGPHKCLGQHLAKLELRTVFDTVFRRIPDLRLAVPVDELPFKNAFSYGLRRLPVTWSR